MGQISGQYNTDINEGTFRNSQIKGDLTQRVPANVGNIVFNKTIAAGAAGADIDGETELFYTVPTGKELIITGAKVIALGTAAGIDASNTCLIAVKDTETTPQTYASKTFSDDPAYPAAKVTADLTLSDFVKVAAGKSLTYAVTQGATADHNGFELIVEGYLADA